MNQRLITRKSYCFQLCLINLVVLFMIGCDQEVSYEVPQDFQSEKNGIMSKPQPEQFDYVEKYLGHIGQGLLRYSKDPEFKKLLYKEIEYQFDGDYNVLVSTLMEKANYDMASQMDAFLVENQINGKTFQSISAFENLDDNLTLYPQVFIPFFEELKASDRLDNGNNPVVMVFEGNEDVLDRPGYVLHNNKVRHTDFPINEEFAKDNEVWVISLNNTRPEDINSQSVRNASLGPPGCVPGNLIWRHGYIANLILHCNLDGFGSGKNDVHIITGSSWDDGINPATGQREYYWTESSDHREVVKISVQDTEIDKNFYVNHRIYTHWKPHDVPNPTGALGDFLYFCFFEHDNWPAGRKTTSFTVSWTGYTLNWTYRSAQNRLARGFINGFNYNYNNGQVVFPASSCDFTYDVNCFEFNTRRDF